MKTKAWVKGGWIISIIMILAYWISSVISQILNHANNVVLGIIAIPFHFIELIIFAPVSFVLQILDSVTSYNLFYTEGGLSSLAYLIFLIVWFLIGALICLIINKLRKNKPKAKK